MKTVIFVVLLGLASKALCSTCSIDGKTLQEGEDYQPNGQCKKFTCFENGFLAEVPCPDIRPKEDCKYVPVDPTKRFPDCCPHYKCA